MKADTLGLRGAALAGAKALEAKFPGIVFTSGRRGVEDQARALSQNLLKNRQFIARTYISTPESRALQAEADKFGPNATAGAIATALLAIMKTWGDDQKARLSKHFSGDAFDVQPIDGPQAVAIKLAITQLPGLDKFLDHEAGLVRWHAQFRA